jgi:hypothetical protein
MRNDPPTMRIRRLWAAMPGLAGSRPRPGYAGGEVAAQGPPYPLRLTKGPSRADFTQRNSVTIPPPPPASQIVDLSQLTG